MNASPPEKSAHISILLQENQSDDEDGIPPEFMDLYKDEELTQTLIDLIHTAADLDILDFQVCSVCDQRNCQSRREGQ